MVGLGICYFVVFAQIVVHFHIDKLNIVLHPYQVKCGHWTWSM